MRRHNLRLVHSSDVHSSDVDPSDIQRDEGHTRDERRRGLRGVVDLAPAQSVDALSIVGDLCDEFRIPAEQIDAAMAELARLEMPIVVTCGNHDALDSASIHARVSVTLSYTGSDAGEQLHSAAAPEGDHILF